MSLSILIVLFAGCVDVGGGGKEEIYLDDAAATCDPTQSAFDDLFYFEAWTAGPVTAVTMEMKLGGDRLANLSLDEVDIGYWYREEWADDLGSDCDDFGQLRFIFTADGQDGQVIETEVAR